MHRERITKDEMKAGQLYGGSVLYIGSFSQDAFQRREGKGELFDYDTGLLVFRGTWRENAKHGYGEYFDDEGACYQGEWVKGKKQGFFLKTDTHGSTRLIYYDNDKLIEQPSTLVVNRHGYVAICVASCMGEVPSLSGSETVEKKLNAVGHIKDPAFESFRTRVREGTRSSFLYGVTSFF